MKNKYYDLIDQTFDFPQDEFRTEDGELYFHDIPLMEVIKQYGTPLKITYLPKISSQIQRSFDPLTPFNPRTSKGMPKAELASCE